MDQGNRQRQSDPQGEQRGNTLRGKEKRLRKGQNSLQVNHKQCDQIGRNFDIWTALGYFLLNKFSNAQAVSTHSLL